MSRILVIDDDASILDSITKLLNAYGHDCVGVQSGSIPDGWTPDVVICDWDLGMYDARNGGEIVTDLRVLAPLARFIICSGLDRDVPDWVEFFSKSDVIEMVRSLGEP